MISFCYFEINVNQNDFTKLIFVISDNSYLQNKKKEREKNSCFSRGYLRNNS